MDETLVGTPDPEEPEGLDDPDVLAIRSRFDEIVKKEFGAPVNPEEIEALKVGVLTTWADIVDSMDRAADAAGNVRRKLDAAGFSPQACDVMASQVWTVLLTSIAGEMTRDRPRLT